MQHDCATDARPLLPPILPHALSPYHAAPDRACALVQGARAPDSLAHLAANQLRRLLVGQLETIPARRRQSQALLQRPLHSMVPAGEAPRASKDWPLVSDEEECEICFMHALACDFATCSHGVCKDCALALCGQVEDGNTPACPFCRSIIGGFTAHGRAGQTFKRFSC